MAKLKRPSYYPVETDGLSVGSNLVRMSQRPALAKMKHNRGLSAFQEAIIE